MPANMRRICIVGTTGSGKTWLGRQLASRLQLCFIDLDDLFWNPGWRESDDATFAKRIRQARAGAEQQGNGWVMAGNYSRMAAETRAHADTIIWLDYSPWRILPALIWRQLGSIINGQPHCNGNVETLRHTFSRQSLFIWFCKTAFHVQRRYGELFTNPRYAGKIILRLRSRAEATRYLHTLPAAPTPAPPEQGAG